MVFSSLIFLYAFLPAVLLLYFLAPGRVKNTVLLLSSLVFYAWSELRYLPLILCTIATGYSAGLAIGRFRRRGKAILVLEAVLCLGSLGLFKYANFLLEALGGIFCLELPLWRLALPLGISFYTFQILSYAVDVYRGTVEPQKNPIDFGVYVVFFPQLIAGPIVRYQELAPQLKSRRSTLDGAYEGAVRFLTGLGKRCFWPTPWAPFAAPMGRACLPRFCFPGCPPWPLPCRFILTSPATVIWLWAWGGFSDFSCRRISAIPICPPPSRPSGGGGTLPWGPGSGTMCIFPWAETG